MSNNLSKVVAMMAMAGLGVSFGGRGGDLFDDPFQPAPLRRQRPPAPTIYIDTPKPLTKRARRRMKGKRP